MATSRSRGTIALKSNLLSKSGEGGGDEVEEDEVLSSTPDSDMNEAESDSYELKSSSSELTNASKAKRVEWELSSFV